MSTLAAPDPRQVLVPCPVCGSRFAWPPVAPCATCRADLAGPLAAELWQLARDEAALQARRAELLHALIATATPPSVPAPPPRPSRRLTEVRAQTILGVVGAALLALAAVVFAAVTWESLPVLVRAAILLAATGAAVLLARWLRDRALLVTAAAVGLLADALLATLVWAAHGHGATGGLADSGGAALAALAASGVAVLLAHERIRWQAWVAAVTWLVADVLAVVTAVDVVADAVVPAVLLGAALVAVVPRAVTSAERAPARIAAAGGAALLLATSVAAAVVLAGADGIDVVWPVVVGVAAAGVWRRVAGAALGTGLATGALTGLAVGGVATLPLDVDEALFGVALVAVAVVVVAAFAGRWSRLLLAGALPAVVPTSVVTLGVVLLGLVGWTEAVAAAWTGAAPAVGSSSSWRAAVAVLFGVGLIVATASQRRDQARAVALVAVAVLAPAAAWLSGGPPLLPVVAAGATAVAAYVVGGRGAGWVFVVSGLVAVGWAAPSPTATAVTAAVVTALALAAGLAPLGRRSEQAALLPVVAAVTGGAAVVAWLPGVADGLAGPVAVAVATLVAVAGRRVDLDALPVAVAGAVTGAGAGVLAGVAGAGLAAASSTAAAVTVGSVVLGLVWREAREASAVYGATAFVAASSTSWLLLRDADVTVPEAYAAVPGLLALVAGVVWMLRDATVRSRQALHPGLLVLVAPTLAVLVGDPADTARALVAATTAAVALLVGVRLRVAVPVGYGVAAGVIVVVTQLAVVADHLPRWATFAALGALLVAASATFERQRVRLGGMRRRMHDVADGYR